MVSLVQMFYNCKYIILFLFNITKNIFIKVKGTHATQKASLNTEVLTNTSLLRFRGFVQLNPRLWYKNKGILFKSNTGKTETKISLCVELHPA